MARKKINTCRVQIFPCARNELLRVSSIHAYNNLAGGIKMNKIINRKKPDCEGLLLVYLMGGREGIKYQYQDNNNRGVQETFYRRFRFRFCRPRTGTLRPSRFKTFVRPFFTIIPKPHTYKENLSCTARQPAVYPSANLLRDGQTADTKTGNYRNFR